MLADHRAPSLYIDKKQTTQHPVTKKWLSWEPVMQQTFTKASYVPA